jgi:uncharacterized protein YpbB
MEHTLALFNEGFSLREIAQRRRISQDAVQAHLATMVEKGRLRATQLVSQDVIDEVLEQAKSFGHDVDIQDIKPRFQERLTHFEIRVALTQV